MSYFDVDVVFGFANQVDVGVEDGPFGMTHAR